MSFPSIVSVEQSYKTVFDTAVNNGQIKSYEFFSPITNEIYKSSEENMMVGMSLASVKIVDASDTTSVSLMWLAQGNWEGAQSEIGIGQLWF